jgi:hypothetical protein
MLGTRLIWRGPSEERRTTVRAEKRHGYESGIAFESAGTSGGLWNNGQASTNPNGRDQRLMHMSSKQRGGTTHASDEHCSSIGGLIAWGSTLVFGSFLSIVLKKGQINILGSSIPLESAHLLLRQIVVIINSLIFIFVVMLF